MRTQQHARVETGFGSRSGRRPRHTPTVEALEGRRLLAGDVVLEWNELLLQSLTSQPPRVPLSRNMAMVHLAMFDAVNAIDRSYESYEADVKSSRGASVEAAAAQAARDTLTALYPGRQADYDAALARHLEGIPNGRARQGIAVGKEAAREILAARVGDGAADIETYTPPDNNPGTWEPTPPDFTPPTSAHVPSVTPFATESSAQFRPGPPPELDSAEYTTAFNHVKAIGSATSAVRTADQSLVAMLYRLPLTNHQVWNRTAQTVARSQGNTLVENARMFALLNVGLHDGLQTSFASKFYYSLWRPITAIREAGDDGNDDTAADPTWMSLHPSTPPYPSYAGNAATIGAVCATVLAEFYGTDDVSFAVDWSPYGFPGVTRTYAGFGEAADEHARSREYGGIHFRFDSDAGQQIGRGVGEYVVDNFMSERDRPSSFHDDGEVILARAPAASAGRPSVFADISADDDNDALLA
jgi:hypothetical protein